MCIIINIAPVIFTINRNINCIHSIQIYFFLCMMKRINNELCKDIQAKVNINDRINLIQDYYYSKLSYQTIFVKFHHYLIYFAKRLDNKFNNIMIIFRHIIAIHCSPNVNLLQTNVTVTTISMLYI